MKRQHLAIIGFGRVGKACAVAIDASFDMQLAGVIRRPEFAMKKLPDPWREVPVAGHISELPQVDAALICVPTDAVFGVAQDLLQRRIPIVECATLEGNAFVAHKEAINRLAENHRARAIVGAGWETGALPLIGRLFEALIPRGHTEITHRPGVSLHHTNAVQNVKNVKGALCTELRSPDNKVQRYVYVELERGANLEKVSESIRSDPLFLQEETLVFQVESLADLEQEGHGVLMERRGISGHAEHQSLLLEGRFDITSFTAHIMLDAVRTLPNRKPGAYGYSLL